MFCAEYFKRIELEDFRELGPRLLKSKNDSCECSFANLYAWKDVTGSVHQAYNGHDYFYFSDSDNMIFLESAIPERNPSAEELAEASAAMQTAGKSGRFFQVREEFCTAHPELSKYFIIKQQTDEFAEYIYEVQQLIDLKGEKLRKKRNLIKQFLRDFPDVVTVDITHGKILNDCLELSEEWRLGQENKDQKHLTDEAKALSRLPDGFSEMGCQGIAAYVQDRLAAYAIYSPINEKMFTESFEKSRVGYKGAAQYINHEMAEHLSGQCIYVNREQD